MSIHKAVEAFKENAEHIINPDDEPFRWNLNNGLWNLCDAVASIERRLDDLDNKIVHISQQIARKKIMK